MLVLLGLQSDTRYKVWVRVKPDGVTYKGYWSAWTEPVLGVTQPSGTCFLMLLKKVQSMYETFQTKHLIYSAFLNTHCFNTALQKFMMLMFILIKYAI